MRLLIGGEKIDARVEMSPAVAAAESSCRAFGQSPFLEPCHNRTQQTSPPPWKSRRHTLLPRRSPQRVGGAAPLAAARARGAPLPPDTTLEGGESIQKTSPQRSRRPRRLRRSQQNLGCSPGSVVPQWTPQMSARGRSTSSPLAGWRRQRCAFRGE
jgi:hypothetical protein